MFDIYFLNGQRILSNQEVLAQMAQPAPQQGILRDMQGVYLSGPGG